MLKMLGLSMISILIVISLTGCNRGSELTADSISISLTEAVDSKFEEVNRIEVLYNDGHEIKIEDLADIEKIIDVLRSIKLNAIDESNVGYLYKLKIVENNRTIELNNTMKIRNKYFTPVGEEITELNRVVIEKGREKYPELLSGIKYR